MDLTGKQGGDLLKWRPFSTDRETQFGDVPDNFSDTSHDSVFTAASKDLTAFGQKTITPDFWRSMLLIGGISLAPRSWISQRTSWLLNMGGRSHDARGDDWQQLAHCSLGLRRYDVYDERSG